jgi:hypothetical protein
MRFGGSRPNMLGSNIQLSSRKYNTQPAATKYWQGFTYLETRPNNGVSMMHGPHVGLVRQRNFAAAVQQDVTDFIVSRASLQWRPTGKSG